MKRAKMHRLLAGWTLLSLAATMAAAHQPPHKSAMPITSELSGEVVAKGGNDQFEPFVTPPYKLDNVQGEWLNLETQLIKPILVTSDGKFVVVANPADDRVVILNDDLTRVVAEIVVGQGATALVERPGSDRERYATSEIWVSVRHQSSVVVISTRSWQIVNLLRPPLAAAAVGAGNASAPGGIAFNKEATKAYVAASFSDEILVFDAVNKTFLTSIPLTLTHNGRVTALNDPMAVISDGERVYVASHLSGNQTIVDTKNGSAIPGGTSFGPEDITISNLRNDPTRSLPDFDVMVIDTASDTVVGHQKEVGTTLFGMIRHPNTREIIVSNFEARNGEFKGEGSFPNGQVVLNRITAFKPGDPPANYNIATTERLGPNRINIAMPTDMAVDHEKRLYVAGYASANIGVFDTNLQFLGALNTKPGPRGLAFSPQTKRLYVLCQAAGYVFYYDVSGALPTQASSVFTLTDPTFEDVKSGRSVFINAANSGAGTTGCFSCHQDLRKDNLGWNLAKFFGEDEVLLTDPDPNWKDEKGVKTTQDMRSLVDMAPYHWRGEQHDLEDFNGAFVGLLKGKLLSDKAFAAMKAFVMSAVYPPNPFQQLSRNYTAAAQTGISTFLLACENCHAVPTGTDASLTLRLLGAAGISAQSNETAQLRGNWTKNSDIANINDAGLPETLWPVTGFGFDNEGQLDSLTEFLSFFFGSPAGVLEFLNEFDTGLAPSTMYSEWLTSASVGQSRIGTYLIDQADNGNCDIAARGRLRISGAWQNVGLVWNSSAQLFVADRTTLGSFSWPTLQAMAAAGDARLLVLGVPVWSGERVGVDRDRDTVFDGDELAGGLDPTDPDTDGDGLWDGYDPQPLQNPNNLLVLGAPQVVPGSVEVVFVNTNAAKIIYETDTFSPSRVEFGTTSSYGFFSGDPLVLSRGSTRWKRRHTVFLRPQPGQGLRGLEDGVDYHFRILTRGQNGATATSANFTLSSLLNPLDSDIQPGGLNLRLKSIDVTSVRSGSTVTWTATAQVVDNHGNLPSAPVTLTCRFTHFAGSNLMQQDIQNVSSNAQGEIVFSSTTTFQSAGDTSFFDIPMSTIVLAPASFVWSEGPTCVEEDAP